MSDSPCPAYLAGFDAIEHGQVDEAAVRRWRESADPLAWVFAAAVLTRLKRAREARAELSRVVERVPESGPLLIASGALHFELGDFEESLACLERAAAVSPRDAGNALTVKSSLATALGWHRDGIDAAERLVTLEPKRAAELHLRLQQLMTLEGNYAEAMDRLRERVAIEPDSAAHQWEAANLLCRLGRFDEVPVCVEQALRMDGATAAALVEAACLLLESGAFAAAEDHALAAARLDPDNRQAHLIVGQLRLWHGDAEGALAASARVLAGDAGCAAAHRERGGALVLLGRYADALTALDAAIARDPADIEAHTWRAEALVKMGRLVEAETALDTHPRRGDSGYWIIDLLRALCILRQCGSGLKGVVKKALRFMHHQPFVRLDSKSLVVTHYELCWAIRDLVAGADPIPSTWNARRRIAVLEATLRGLQGNRSTRPTTHRGGDRELAYVPVRSPRAASVRALGLINTAPPERVLRAFDTVIADYPDSSLPVCYRGELRLWLGDYAEARTDLEAAIAQCKTTRWAYYGLALLANVEGDPRRALAICKRSVQVIGNYGPPIHAHRGEALRRLGQTSDAIQELRLACQLSPTRLSGRVNLALAEGDAGDLNAEAAGYRWLCAQVPGLASDTGFDLRIRDWADADLLSRDAIRALLERMLLLMRGNRASSFATWISRRGMVRVAGAVHSGPTAFDRFRADEPNRRRVLRTLLENAIRRGG